MEEYERHKREAEEAANHIFPTSVQLPPSGG
jgi:hypothetical protein